MDSTDSSEAAVGAEMGEGEVRQSYYYQGSPFKPFPSTQKAHDERFALIKKARADGQSLREIGLRHGISRERVRQLLLHDGPYLTKYPRESV